MTNSLLGISVTGIRVAQTALNTTGHNISNANVEGYSRQRVINETTPASLLAGQFLGNGTRVASIERIANDFVDGQLRVDSSLYNDIDSYYANISQLDNLLSDASTGLASGLEAFFSSMQNGADDPTSIPARQLIMSQAENLADRFNTIYSSIENIENGLNAKLTSAVSEINSLVKNIANLNQKVADAMGTGATPNDLIDQRQQTILELSRLVSVQTFNEGFGQVNIVVGSGQTLVIGNQARQLDLLSDPGDVSKKDVVLRGSQGVQGGQVITDLVSGGELGGILRFRDTILDNTFNEFGRVAIAMADTFNKVHRQGIDLNNGFGRDFFYDVNDPTIARNRVIGNSTNAPPNDRVAALSIVDSTQLQASNYDVSISNGNAYRIVRESDGELVASGSLNGSFPFEVNFDGLELSLSRGSFQAGDQFKLVPFKSGGRDFSSSIASPQSIAFGSPLLTDASLANTGTGQITAGEVLSLVDSNNLPLPLLGTPGEMNPPLLVQFTSNTTYDILDNSDPGNPQQLTPPIRNQRYIVGASNPLFSTDPGETMVSTRGDLIGLPEGRTAANNASLQPSGALAPDFSLTNFSAATDQFAVDVVVSGTPSGINDGTFTVLMNSAAILDESDLLREINTQLSTTDVRAYIADNGSLAFRLNTASYGDISVQNYDADPDAGGNAATAGQANLLFGFDIEGSTFTTTGNADGFSGDGMLTNAYPAEAIQIISPASTPGARPTTVNLFTELNASARETASMLNNISGVSANAFNYVELSNFQVSRSEPLQIQINGEDLLTYSIDSATGLSMLGADVPDPQENPEDFYDYLANSINSNSNLSALGVHAVAGSNAVSGAAELRIYEREGNDLSIELTALESETLDVSDGENPNLRLRALGNSVGSSITVGGRMDVRLAEGMRLTTFPEQSMLFGDTSADDFALSTYMGIQAAIEGAPVEGDVFNLDFNNDAASDNRNALTMVGLERKRTLGNGIASYGESYSALVENIGIDTASSRINLDASEKVLQQSEARRNSISGVNLDEEAANLIKFEQMFSANAQVISVARDLFDRLISVF